MRPLTQNVGPVVMIMKEGMKNLELHYPLLSLIKFCETFCMAECCDINAFDVSSLNMEGWIEDEGIDNARTALKQIESTISFVTSQSLNVYSDTFNYSWTPSEFKEYFKVWAAELQKAMTSYERFHKAAYEFFKSYGRLRISDKCAKIMVKLEKEPLASEDLVDDDYVGLTISGQYKYQFLQEFMFHLQNLQLKGIIQPNSGKYELTENGKSCLDEIRKRGFYKSIFGE
jgi:hypothetical protein